MLDPIWRAELAGYLGVDVDPTRGIVAVIVTDCAGERVEGATVTFDPPAEAIGYWDPTFTDGWAIGPDSPAAGAGTPLDEVAGDIEGACPANPPSIGAYEAR